MRNQITQSPLLSSLSHIRHGFTNRATPKEAAEEINLSTATAHQVHKDHLLWVEGLEKAKTQADAVATRKPGLAVGVFSADCAPLLFVARRQQKTLGVMAVHAGWRGTALEIARKSFETFFLAIGEPAQFYCSIGPCISFESFEVGEDVIQAFPRSLDQGIAKFLRHEQDKKKFLFDLPGENARQIREAAQKMGAHLQVEILGHCTLKDPELYPSFRRDQAGAGRILSFIAFDR